MPVNREKTEEHDLPLIYRLILKLPNLSLGSFSDRFQAYFWIVIVPVFAFCNGCVNLLLFVELPVPFNVIASLLYSVTVAVLFIRILIERELNTRKAILGQGGFQWNVDKACEEYVDILKKKHKS